jgi:hypothetical protein
MRCVKCNSTTATHKDYDKEFQYADEIEPNVAKIMEQTEQRTISQSSTQAREEFYRLYEQNVNARKEHRFRDQEELHTKRTGHIYHMSEFLRLLKKALPAGYNAWYTDKGGMANTLGLYVSHPIGQSLNPLCSHEKDQPHYVGFVQVPWMQEFEELHFDRYNIPLGSKRRGWRTILLKLIESKVLSETQAHEVFGAPLGDVLSRRYLSYLQFLRNKEVQ